MDNIYTNEKINLISIILAWSIIFVLGVSQYLINTSRNFLIFIALGCIYIVPTYVYIQNKYNKNIKYFMVFGTMIYIYILLFIQNGMFDNTYYLLITIAITAIYFDIKITMYATIINVLVSGTFYFTVKALFFPIFRFENFISLETAFIFIGIIISIQTYWSKKLLNSYKRLYEKAIRDNLTTLYNRNYFDIFFIETVDNYKLQKKKLGVIAIDIDDFKNVNDSFGHSKGDVVLKGVAECIVQASRGKVAAFRIGGEEFVMLLLDTNKDEASIIAEDVRRKVEIQQHENISVTISLGVTLFEKTDSKEDVLARADKALYMSKNNGKNCIYIL